MGEGGRLAQAREHDSNLDGSRNENYSVAWPESVSGPEVIKLLSCSTELRMKCA